LLLEDDLDERPETSIAAPERRRSETRDDRRKIAVAFAELGDGQRERLGRDGADRHGVTLEVVTPQSLPRHTGRPWRP
jgi:hypothetical protein